MLCCHRSRWKMSYRNHIFGNVIGLFLLAQGSSILLGDTGIAFGPEDFTRATGPQVDVIRNFTVRSPINPYTLHIDNGGAIGQFSRVSSAVITLNGIQVVGPNDFNQNVAVIEKAVS